MRIKCPICGLRDHSEFQYGGDATKAMPNLTMPTNDSRRDKIWQAWYDYVYVRDNPKGEHLEYWQHVRGCRHWLKVNRNSLTHAISKVSLACEEVEEGEE